MHILIIGGGGREHALAWKAAQSELVKRVSVAPGNAGTALEAKCGNVQIEVEDQDALLKFAIDEGVSLTIVGPEGPLVAGIVDKFQAAGLQIFGPRKAASQLEGSKDFSKAFMLRHDIPTAGYATFTELEPALVYLQHHGAPVVIKADGLAAGKGVTVATTLEQAEQAVRDCLQGNVFGDAGHRVVIEEMLVGEEISFICMVDGRNILPLASSQDHKHRDEGDSGPNTGGMGAYSPAPIVDDALHRRIMTEVIEPTVSGLVAEGMPFTGFLFAGLMISAQGAPSVIEYNCRLGDPETQPILMRLKTDLISLCLVAVAGQLSGQSAQWDSRSALSVVLAAGGYPFDYAKGEVIEGLSIVSEDARVFHAGTRFVDHKVLTHGGRVLSVCALGKSVHEAQQRAYHLADQIHWPDCYMRRDIGHKAVAREAAEKT